MDSGQSSGHGVQDTSRLRESVSMALRQLQQPQPTRAHSDEIPESEDGEVEDRAEEEEEEEEDDGGGGDANSDGEVIDDDLNEFPLSQRRHSVSSAGSHYSPSAAEEANLGTEAPDHHSLQPALPAPLNKQKPAFPPSSPYSTVPPTPTHTYRSSPRKRSLSPPSRRLATEGEREPSPRPFKRHKTAPLNPAYLTLLNADILDAAHRYTAAGADAATDPLSPSQVGLTHWTTAEKTLFFEALARLGGGAENDIAGIAARIRTKGVLEVGAYLSLLKGAPPPHEKEKENRVGVEEMPAAVELSQACCAALEEAADAVSVRQEGHEEGVERRKWGEEGWLVGVGNWRALEAEPPEGLGGCLGLLRVGSWLRLSGRVFMNSAVEEYNWMRVEGKEPAVRATALEDFHALTVEVTRRLVAATIFVGEARVKARRELYPESRNRVWKQDVEAAALSLGLPTNSRRFWAKCARRLRLDVYEHEDAIVAGWEDEGEQEPMSYDEVERALGLGSEATEGDAAAAEEAESSEEEEIDQEDQPSAAESDNGSVELGAETPHASEHEEPLPEEDETEKQAVTREMNELLVHSALEYPKTGKPRAALRTRIRAERAREAYADRLDAKASYYEEKRMWAMLERQPPMELVKPDVPEAPRKLTKRTVDDLIKGFARTPGDWRDKLEVVPSRWEMDYALAQEEKREAKEAKATARAESGDEI